MSKEKRRKEAKDQIEAFVENTLKDFDLNRSEILDEYCPLCHTLIVECPRCSKSTPLGLYCHNCKNPIPLEDLTERVSEKVKALL